MLFWDVGSGCAVDRSHIISVDELGKVTFLSRLQTGRPGVRCPMPPNTLRVHTEYVFVKSVVYMHNCGGGDRGRVAIYRPFGELRRAKIVLSPVWCSRPTTGVPLAHATMNFVGLDLTASDRWHQKQQQQ
ncbi:hypothetical protein TNCV_3305701 [Trichonephila clavipes]|nr:hypothetical protein TNCV_3305701 [Trichonephila clavipes]